MPRPLHCPPELFELDLRGKTYLVTGGNSGLGLETSHRLLRQGGQVVIACRNPQLGEQAIQTLRARTPGALVHVLPLDLADLESVRSFARAFLARFDSLHGLLNNAGIMNTPLSRTKDGFESQFGVNHLGHFLLTELLLPLLIESAPSRIVNVSSAYHDVAMGREGRIDFDDPNFERRKYDGWLAYAQSKLANLLHARELAKRLEGTGVASVSVHPGWVPTRLARHSLPLWLQDGLLRHVLRPFGMIQLEDGIQSSLFALLSPQVPAQSGSYFSQVGGYRDRAASGGGWPLVSPNPEARDEGNAQRLAELSRRLVGLAPAR
ncbi:MAG TPA: SDR family oxidoreductase [Polyangiaceae bacterium]|nr:SDR family oxidoreductase [Polyangiaceae bacterium]